ncbi:M16 family metallopeptidase [Hymenobacter actinosclerus]|uniref:Predicted Zn-dependent peptidase n=1 Tax=Hymenobacter actinosclerus TaxID=82805 RepID=A0A1I0HKW5_9BACT|nr:pitrilysin family protein [Hymenobacter actinosclerus]SET84586.1 Predicted Zn-dependent peptidase [Hymenobacter actinosclerus]
MILDRTVAPPVQPLARVTLPAADVLSLPNGARLHVLRNDAQPVVRLQVVFPAGKWYDPSAGVSLLAARLLLDGTRTRTARQIADEVAFFGASLDCEQGFDRATLTLYCLSRHLPQLLPLVQDVLTNPTFPETELALVKTRTIQNVRVERQKTSYLASESFSRHLFGPGYPYGVTFDETVFQDITSEQVRSFYQQHYNFAEAEIFLCGDVVDEQVALLTEMLGAPAGTQAATAASTPAPTVLAPRDYVTVEGSLQASLRIGRLWPALSHPQAHALQVLVKVLGGYFGSRLMKNIREDKGFTYGIYSSVHPREHATSFMIGSDVNATNAPAAIEQVQLELRRLQEEPIPLTELQTVKNYMSGKFANELSTVFEQCDKYKNLVFFNLPASYYSDFVEQVQATDAATLQELAQEYLSPESMVEVVSGPKQ